MTRAAQPFRVYYEDPAVTLYHGDCRDVLPTLPPVDHVITDPPYEEAAHKNGRRSNGATRGNIAEYRPVGFAAITEDERHHVGGLMARGATGWILVFCQVEGAMLWREALAPARYMRTQIWRKVNSAPQFTGDRPASGYESIVTCWAGAGRSRWNGGGAHGVYDHGTQHNPVHQTQKPEGLILELVNLFTNPGDRILDPYAGSGTTGVAAKRAGRRCILIERDESHCKTIARRLSQAALAFGPVARDAIQSDLLTTEGA